MLVLRQALRRHVPSVSALRSFSSHQHSDLSSFGLTAEQQEFKSVAEAFARDRLAPFSAHWDEAKLFPVEVLKEAAQLGFAGLYVPDDYGGSGLSRADGAVIFETLAYADVSATAYLTIHNMVAGVINRFGNEELKQRFLPRLCSMDAMASYCLTEPGSGSDAASLQTSATQDDGRSGWVLNGSKAFISGAGTSDVYLVMARTPADSGQGSSISAFLVEKGTPGLTFGPPERKLGWRSQPTAAVHLDAVFVPASNMLGPQGTGFKIAMAALDGGRINIAACSVGGAAYGLDYALRYTSERRQFGRPIADFQATQFKLADMATSLAAARLMVRHAACALDAQAPSATLDAAMAKRFATDACFGVANDALQLLGGYGYLSDFPMERLLRDLRVHSILEGTNEIMRVIIHRQLQKLRDC